MKIKKYKIGIVIPTHNRKNHLRVVLDCIKNQRIDGIHIETIVVVDGSTDGTLEMLKKYFPDAHIIKGTGMWWFTNSFNEGVKKALKYKPDFILTMNDDGEIDPGFISRLVSSHKRQGEKSIIGAITITKEEPKRMTFSGVRKINKKFMKRYAYIGPTANIDNLNITGVYTSEILITRGMLVPADVFDIIGLFDEKFPQYGSDDDFAFRANKNGFQCYVSWEAVVYDNNKISSTGLPSNHPSLNEFLKGIFYKYSVNYIPKSLRFYRKHGYSILLPFYFFYRILGLFNAFLFKYKSKTN